MTKKMYDPDWKSEFIEFKNGTGVEPRKAVSDCIFALVEKDLKISPWTVFSKLSLIHFISSLATLSFCPQFGFRIFGSRMGLMNYFMALGTIGCPLACGFFFLGSTLLLAVIVLKGPELYALRTHRFTSLGSLGLLSLGFFIMVDPGSVVFSFAFAWMIGALLGGFLVIEFAHRARSAVSSVY